MADRILTWGEFLAAEVPLKLVDNGDDSYTFGIEDVGDGVAEVIDAPFAEVVSGKYPLKFVDNGDGSYSFAVSSGFVPEEDMPTIEVPTGVIDGVNVTFTLSATPTKLLLFRNGQLQDTFSLTPDYSLVGATITFIVPPTGGLNPDDLVACFWS